MDDVTRLNIHVLEIPFESMGLVCKDRRCFALAWIAWVAYAFEYFAWALKSEVDYIVDFCLGVGGFVLRGIGLEIARRMEFDHMLI
jgi:hypothetical protein